MDSAGSGTVSSTVQPQSQEEVFEKLTAILADILVLNQDEIKPSDTLVQDLDADSIGFLELTYRLRTDFDLDVPEAKVDEETLRMPMLDGLNHLEKTIGGTTLFEFMKDGAFASTPGNDELNDRMRRFILDSFSDGSFRKPLLDASERANSDPELGLSIAALVQKLNQSPEFNGALATALEKDSELGSQLKRISDLYGPAVGEERVATQEEILSLWSTVIGGVNSPEQITQVRVGQLAKLMGTDVPKGFKADALVTTLQLRDLFGFITVDSYVHYIMFLQSMASKEQQSNGAGSGS